MTPRPTWRDRFFCRWRRRGWRGYHFLQRVVPGGRTGGALVVDTLYGSRFLLDPNAYIDGIVIAEGFSESEVVEALRAHLTDGSVLWDIGANFGLHAITLARLQPAATIVAFEPNPVEHARLLRHREWNAPQAITCSLALSDTAGVMPLHLGPAGNSGMTTLEPWPEANYSGIVQAAVACGDHLVAKGLLPQPTAIKLDVEGHELAVLRGLATTLADRRCQCVVFEDGAEPNTPVKNLLHAAGFKLEPLARTEHTAHHLINLVGRRRPPA